MDKLSGRPRDKRLQDLLDKGANLYSYSKLSSIDECQYGAYLTYIKKDRGIHNIYDVCGSCIHDKLESIMNGSASKEDLAPTLQAALDEMDMVGIDFPKDFRGGTGIRDKWIANMSLFCRDFIKPKGNFKTEELLILKLSDNRYLQGYADLIRYNKDGSVQVFDWKTSSQFRDEDLLHYGRQLVAYSLALEQAGYIVKTPAWIMLKYLEVSWMGKLRKGAKSESQIKKICDRCKLGDTIKYSVIDKMNKAGFTEGEIHHVLTELCETNSIECLPQQIREQFKVLPYVRPYPLDDDLKKECIEYINKTADKFEELLNTGNWEPMHIEKGKDFKCLNLCSHRKTCEALKRYLNGSNDFLLKI